MQLYSPPFSRVFINRNSPINRNLYYSHFKNYWLYFNIYLTLLAKNSYYKNNIHETKGWSRDFGYSHPIPSHHNNSMVCILFVIIFIGRNSLIIVYINDSTFYYACNKFIFFG